jgi:hypothetical protein
MSSQTSPSKRIQRKKDSEKLQWSPQKSSKELVNNTDKKKKTHKKKFKDPFSRFTLSLFFSIFYA